MMGNVWQFFMGCQDGIFHHAAQRSVAR